MRKMLKASVLMLALAIPVWAVDIGIPVAPPPLQGNMGNPVAPPPDGRTANTEPAKTGEMDCPIATKLAMTLLQNLLVLF